MDFRSGRWRVFRGPRFWGPERLQVGRHSHSFPSSSLVNARHQATLSMAGKPGNCSPVRRETGGRVFPATPCSEPPRCPGGGQEHQASRAEKRGRNTPEADGCGSWVQVHPVARWAEVAEVRPQESPSPPLPRETVSLAPLSRPSERSRCRCGRLPVLMGLAHPCGDPGLGIHALERRREPDADHHQQGHGRQKQAHRQDLLPVGLQHAAHDDLPEHRHDGDLDRDADRHPLFLQIDDQQAKQFDQDQDEEEYRR